MVPTEYEFQRIAVIRGLSEEKSFKRLEAGFKGEEKFYRYLKDFGCKHWIILRNKWFKNDSNFECDFILITVHAIYVFEVKNYFGKFVYENGQSFSRGVAITYNPINQARNARLHLQNLMRHFTVKGALVFIGEHNQVCVEDEILDIRVLETNDVYEFIQAIKREEKQFTGRYLNADEIVAQLERFEIDPPYLPVAYTRGHVARARKGIFCANCQQKVLVKRDKYVSCRCGLRESKEEAIVRTACEYGVLTYGRDFTLTDIENFIDKQASRNYLRKVLTKHFNYYNESTGLVLRNIGVGYSSIKNQFTFDLPKMMLF